MITRLLTTGAVVASAAVAATSPLQERAQEVRAAVPPAIAYYYDHGTWRGMTLAKLRHYDRTLRNITVRRANQKSFCILTTKKPFVHFDGPGGQVRRGLCGQQGAVVRYVPRPGSEPPPEPSAKTRIRSAIPAVEAYYADHGGYAGMTIASIRTYDSSIRGVTIVRATRSTYCIQSGSGEGQYHKDGPGRDIVRGPCP